MLIFLEYVKSIPRDRYFQVNFCEKILQFCVENIKVSTNNQEEIKDYFDLQVGMLKKFPIAKNKVQYVSNHTYDRYTMERIYCKKL